VSSVVYCSNHLVIHRPLWVLREKHAYYFQLPDPSATACRLPFPTLAGSFCYTCYVPTLYPCRQNRCASPRQLDCKSARHGKYRESSRPLPPGRRHALRASPGVGRRSVPNAPRSCATGASRLPRRRHGARRGAVRLTYPAREGPDPRWRLYSGGRRRPCLMRRRSEDAEGGSGDQVLLDVEGIVDGGVCGEEPLG
jgi:hypothetical protein